MINERLKKARKHIKVSHKKLAKEIGKSEGTVINYEKGETQPPVNIAIEIAKYCNVNEI